MVIFSSVDQRLQNKCFLATWSHHGRARAWLQPLRVLRVPLYNHGLRISVGGRSSLPKKVNILISKPFCTNLAINHYALSNNVTIAFVSVGGRRSRPSPPGPEWFRKVKCRPSYGLTLLHWSFLQTCLHPWPTNGWTHLWRSHGSWWGLKDARQAAGNRQAGSQAVRQAGY